MNQWKTIKNLGLILVGLTMTIDSASANIGKVLLAVGEVNAQREQLTKLSRGDELLEKDIVITGKRGRAQLFMIDGAKIAVKPNSELALEEYQFKQDDETVIGTSESSMTMSLIKGGFRTISGAIGAGNDKSGYKVKTPIATIGIRGTDYSALICDTSCISIGGSGTVAEGVYFGVVNGAIMIRNIQGELILEKNQYGFVASANEAPRRITAPPQNLMSDSTNSVFSQPTQSESDANIEETQITDIGNDADLPGSDVGAGEPGKEPPGVTLPGGVEPQIIVPIESGDDQGNLVRIDSQIYDFSNARSIAYTAGLDSSNGFSIVSNTPVASLLEDAGGLTQFYALSSSGNFGSEFNLFEAQAFNVGFDQASGIAWGRWSNGFIQANLDNGEVQLFDLNNASFHWAIDTAQNNQSLPINGSAIYSLVGNTDPTNNLGEIGLLGNATFFADFTNQLVASELSLGIGEQVWQASGAGSIADGSPWFSGLYNSVLIDGQDIGGGSFSGFFSTQLDASASFPAGVGLVYSLYDNFNNPSQIVNGTLIFGRAIP